MDYMTKTEFAERCGVSKVTVFNWIKSDKDGIGRYTSRQGISAAIFNDPAWSNMDTKEGALTRAAQMKKELESWRQKAEGYKIDLDAMTKDRDELKGKLAATEAELKEQRAAYQIDMDAMRRERDEAKQEAARIRDLESRVADLEADKTFLQGQYQQQTEMLARLMLPAPRRTFGQAVKDLFGIKSKQEPQI